MRLEMNRGIQPPGNKGFTLIEVLITMAIFSIGVLAVASMQYWSVRNTASGNVMTLAANLARAQMETLKSVPDVTSLTTGASLNPIDADGNPDPDGIFTRTWVIANPLGTSGTRRIDVTVGWRRQGQNRSVVLTSISRGNGT
jgi:type IV pilus assembly protein PilV